jgi:hypothetical protein
VRIAPGRGQDQSLTMQFTILGLMG